MFFWWFSLLFTLPYAVLLLWYRYKWHRMPVFHAAEGFHPKTRLTVLVPVRNEEVVIESCIRSLAAQNYPPALLEVIFIDDHSTDQTAAIASGLLGSYKHMRWLSLANEDRGSIGKKAAITYGVGQAKGSWIVCTDADCHHGVHWLRTLAARMEAGGVQFIAAPVAFEHRKGLLQAFQWLDFTMLQGIAGASVHAGLHAMCNGANLAYERAAFDAVGGFEGIDKLPTGDDMLLMHKIWKKYPGGMVWLKAPDAIVTTPACLTWARFFQQRIRWASKAAFYDDRRIFWVLLLVYLFNASFLALAVAAFFSSMIAWIFLMQLLVKTAIEWMFLHRIAQFYGCTKRLVWFPFLQPLHIAYTLIAGWLGRFGKYEWKGRMVSHGRNEAE